MKSFLLFAVVVVCIIITASCECSEAPGNIVEMDRKRSITLLLHHHKPTFLLFYGPPSICKTCKDLQNELFQFANRTRGLTRVGFLDANRFGKIAVEGYGIKKLPTILFWPVGSKNGKKGTDYSKHRDRELEKEGQAIDADELEEFLHEKLIHKEVPLSSPACPRVTPSSPETVAKLAKEKSSSKKILVMFHQHSNTDHEIDIDQEGKEGKSSSGGKEEKEMESENENDEEELSSASGSSIDPELVLFSTFKLMSVSPYFRHQVAFAHSSDFNLLDQLCGGGGGGGEEEKNKKNKKKKKQQQETQVQFRLFSVVDGESEKLSCDHIENSYPTFKDPLSASTHRDAGNFYFPLAKALAIHARPPLPDPKDKKNPMSTSRTIPVHECKTLRECFQNHAEKPFVVRNTPEMKHFTKEKLLNNHFLFLNDTVVGFSIEGSTSERQIGSVARDYLDQEKENEKAKQKSNENYFPTNFLDINVFNDEIPGLLHLNGQEELQFPPELDEFDADAETNRYVGRKRKMSPLFTFSGAHTWLHADQVVSSKNSESLGGGGFMHLVEGEKHWRFIDVLDAPKFFRDEKETIDKMDQKKRHDRIIEENNIKVYSMTLRAGDTMIFPPGWLHEVWTLGQSFGFVSYLTLKGAVKVREDALRLSDPLRGL